MKPNIEDYIKLVKVLQSESIDNSVICAIVQEVAKDLRMSVILESKSKDDLKTGEWRKDPATDKQKELLDKYKLAYSRAISKGEASDLIEQQKHKVTDEKVE